MAWERLALIQAAGENTAALDKVARMFGYDAPIEQQQTRKEGAAQNTQQTEPEETETSTDKKISQRPPTRFLRINSIQNFDNAKTNRPIHLDQPNMSLQASKTPPGTYCFALPSQLLPLSGLLPFLHNGLGQQRPAKKLDHRRITRLFAQARAIKRLPRLMQQRWPQRLQIIVDSSRRLEPYWADFAFISTQLKNLLGAEAVTVIRFDAESLDTQRPYCISWPTQDNDEWRIWQAPTEDVAILILSDLGVADSQLAARIRWQRLLKSLHRHSAPMLTLSPVAQSPDNRLLCRQVRPNPLNDNISLARHPKRDGFVLPELKAAELKDIFALLSALPVIDAGLLRRLRKALHWGSSDLESQLWNHADMSQGVLGIYLEGTAAKKYSQHYLQHYRGTEQAKKLWKTVEEHHKNAFQGLRQLEKFNQCVLEGIESAELQHYYKSLTASIAQTDADSSRHTGLLMQCRTLLACMPDNVWHTDLATLGYDAYAMANAEDIRAGRWPDRLPPGFDPNQLQWVLNESEKKRQVDWHIIQTGGQGQFSIRRADSVGAENITYTPLTPVLTLQALATFQPSLHFASDANKLWELVSDTQLYTLNTSGIVSIRTTRQQVELEAIVKPDWASGIGRDTQGLFATLDWLNVRYKIVWQVGEEEGRAYWHWPEPFNEDKNGLYVDVDIKGITQRFRWISAGEFLMGSPQSEAERRDNETQCKVILSKGYWLADTACTQALWKSVMGGNPASFQDDLNNPVENVSWKEVQDFIEKLNQLVTGLSACLPTEAQWEYACRAGTQTAFSFGDNITAEQVNYNGKYPYGDGKKGQYREQTVTVGSLPPNPWGLYEMHGNVWEWCNDWYADYLPDIATDPVGPAKGSFRVLRGGSWFYNGGSARSASRYHSGSLPALDDYSTGFRLALGQPAAMRQRIDKEQVPAIEEKNLLSRLLERIKIK